MLNWIINKDSTFNLRYKIVSIRNKINFVFYIIAMIKLFNIKFAKI